jgi:hypothetical protein
MVVDIDLDLKSDLSYDEHPQAQQYCYGLVDGFNLCVPSAFTENKGCLDPLTTEPSQRTAIKLQTEQS